MQIIDERYKVSRIEDQTSDFYVPETQLSHVYTDTENVDQFFPVIQQSQAESQVNFYKPSLSRKFFKFQLNYQISNALNHKPFPQPKYYRISSGSIYLARKLYSTRRRLKQSKT